MYRSIWLNLAAAGCGVVVLFVIGLSLDWSETMLAWLTPVAITLAAWAYGVRSGQGFPPRAPH